MTEAIDSRSPEKIIEDLVDDYEKLNSTNFHLRQFWNGLGVEVVHALGEAGFTISRTEVFPAIGVDEQKEYTFASWIEAILKPVDDEIQVRNWEGIDQLTIRIPGGMNIATVQAPPTGVFSEWFMVYPRQIQVEIFRRLVFGINAWCQLATDMHTGKAIE